MIAPIHLKKKIDGDYRLIVISDIHGHLDDLKALLKKVQYTSHDYLVILGDFVEKGDQVIETIRFIRELEKNERTFVLSGNCEWALQALLTVPELASEIPRYLKRVSTNGCIREKYNQLHLYDGHETMLGIQKKIYHSLKEEIDYISHLPVTLRFDDFLFVHAGIEKRKDYQKSTLSSLLEMKYFLLQGHLLNETVVVGHMPVSNYYDDSICNDILIDKKKKIICIDGGVGVKTIAQLNALIITKDNQNIAYSQEHIHHYMECVALCDVAVSQEKEHKIGYPYFQVKILKKGQLSSLCYQEETQQTLYIRNEFLYQRENQWFCQDDYTDARLNVKKGDRVYMIDDYGDEIYALSHQRVGWIKKEYLRIKSKK